MGKGGISLQQVNSLLTWQIHIHPRPKSSQGFGLLVAIILVAAFPSQLSGPILTGSITWWSSYRLTENQRDTSIHIHAGYEGNWSSPDRNFKSSKLYEMGNSLAPGIASTAWQDSLEVERTMKRVIRAIAHLPINSTLKDVTLPNFAVSKLEWARDPMKELPQVVAFSLHDNSDWIPFKVPGLGTFALTPDSWIDPSGITSETRFIVGVYGFPNYTPSPFGDLPANIGFIISSCCGCLIYGRVTYVAGAAECRECRISSRVTLQNDTALTMTPSYETPYAIDMMGAVGVVMALQNNSLPRAYNNLNGYVTELLIRSYAASWTYIRRATPSNSSAFTDIQIAVPTSPPNVLRWRAWLWLWLNLLFTLSGLLFLFVQRLSGQQLIGSPSVAALLLDTSEILHQRDRALCNFSTLAEDDEGIGHLRFTREWTQGGHRQIEIVEE